MSEIFKGWNHAEVVSCVSSVEKIQRDFANGLAAHTVTAATDTTESTESTTDTATTEWTVTTDSIETAALKILSHLYQSRGIAIAFWQKEGTVSSEWLVYSGLFNEPEAWPSAPPSNAIFLGKRDKEDVRRTGSKYAGPHQQDIRKYYLLSPGVWNRKGRVRAHVGGCGGGTLFLASTPMICLLGVNACDGIQCTQNMPLCAFGHPLLLLMVDRDKELMFIVIG